MADYEAYLSSLDDLGSRDLTERERAVRATMDTAGWVVLEELWGAVEASKLDELVRTRSDKAEDFVAKTAYVRGLRTAREAHTALSKVAERKRREATDE